MADEIIKILCISKTLVAPDVGAIQHEILRYYPEEYNEDLFNDERRAKLDNGGMIVMESWNKEYRCAYIIVTKWPDHAVASFIENAKDIGFDRICDLLSQKDM